MQQLVDTVEHLYRLGYLHRDLSYFNLLVIDERAIISDRQTMIRVEVSLPAWQLGRLIQHVVQTVPKGWGAYSSRRDKAQVFPELLTAPG